MTSLFLGPHFIHAQLSSPKNLISPKIGIKITSPKTNQTVPVGQLIIYGTSSDTPETNCKVFVDWNDTKPMQNVTGIGPGGLNDYSKWTFTYTDRYHLIGEGMNEITSKISCYNSSADNNVTTKFNSINIIGLTEPTNSSIRGTYESLTPKQFRTINGPSLLPQFAHSSGLKNDSKNISKVEEPKSNIYIEISGGYSDDKNNNGEDKIIKFKTSSSQLSSRGNKTQDVRNYFDIGHQDLNKYIHNLIREKLDRLSD